MTGLTAATCFKAQITEAKMDSEIFNLAQGFIRQWIQTIHI